MTATLPVILLLCFNAYVLLGAFLDKRYSRQRFLAPTLLFFFSGMPAVIYQIVWQRALFAVYGVNSESVTVVVTAFMIGLGLGSLLGGWLSTKFPDRAIWMFAVAEFGVALFGIISLSLFHLVAAYTAGATLPAVVILSLALLIFPTVCMGATLPLLTLHLIRKSRTVGFSVGVLYFANTFGSAFACFLCAKFILRDFGQSGSVRIAAGLNLLVAIAALVLGRRTSHTLSAASDSESSLKTNPGAFLPIGWAMLLAASVGFISLGFEITWFRVFVLASSDRAPAFALLLATFLAGIAAGAFIAGKLTGNIAPAKVLQVIANLLLLAGAISCYLTPLVAWLSFRGLAFLISAPAFFLVAALLGAVFTLVCALTIPAGSAAGRGVSLIYIANIGGCASGSLLVGFVLMNRFGLLYVTSLLALCAVAVGILVLFSNRANVAPFRISFLSNPKVLIHVDDGRRWLLSHPDTRYDVIVQNTSFYWRDHSSELLSADYLQLIRRHLSSGGLYYYNSTGSDDVLATGLSVFPHGLRVVNFLAVSNASLSIDKDRFRSILLNYSIDGLRMFDPGDFERSALLEKYLQFADTFHQPQVSTGFESDESMRTRIRNPMIITDDNMGWEWRDLGY